MSYIVPRDKPKRCTRPKCRFMDRDTLDCRLQDKSWELFEEQYEHCPLIEVPTPYGRLIDADAIQYTHAIARSLDDGHNWNELCVTQDEIDDAPTIIEAEE